jgi:hypothetical protein
MGKPTLAQYLAIQSAYDYCVSAEGMEGGKHATLITVLGDAGIRTNSREQAFKAARKILKGDWRDEKTER